MAEYYSKEQLLECKKTAWQYDMYDLEDFLEEVPTADVVEVKRGEWIEREEVYCDIYYTCSNCNNDWTTIDGTPIENHMNYCPNCGAKMDGRREE